MKNKTSQCPGLNTVALLLWSMGIGIFLIGMPKYCDDWWYMERLRGWFESQGIWYPTDGGDVLRYGIPWREIFAVWRDHILTDNSRLCNIAVVPFLLLPKWVGSSLALLAWIYAMWGSSRLARVDWRRSPLVPVALTLWGFFMPWREQMGALDYQFNYVLTSGFAVWFLLFFRDTGSEGKSRLLCLGLGGLLLGAWQEAFAAPVFCGLVVLYLFCADCRERKYIWALAGLGAGLMWLAAAPGLRVRIGGEVLTARFTWYRFILMFIQHPSFCLMALLVLIGIARDGWRRVVADRFLLFLIVSATVPLVLAFLSNAMRRTGWWCDLASVMGIMILLRDRWKEYWERYSFKNIPTAIILILLTVAHFAFVDYHVLRISRQMRALLAAYRNNPGAALFADFTTETDSPWICFFMPDFTMYTYNWNVMTVNNYYLGHRGVMEFKVIPKALRDIDADSGMPVAGNSGLRLYDGYLIRKSDSNSPLAFNADIDFGVIRREGVSMHCYRFRSEADGREYEVVYPQEAGLEQIFGIYVRIDATDE